MNDLDKRIEFLESKALELRKTILTMIHAAQSGHPGGSLSISDVVAVLYYDELNVDPKNPDWEQRDRLVLSKGHCCPVLYSVLAMKGYYEYDVIYTLRKLGSILQGHPHMKYVPGIDMTTGSLGQGLSAGVGMAIGAKAKKIDSRVFVILGDGEVNEGQIWEAAMSAVKYKLDNLIAIVDNNNLQNDGHSCEIMPVGSLKSKWEAFGWKVIETDGHSIPDILKAFEMAKKVNDKPVCIIAKTVKGKGVSFMEDICEWHGSAPNDEQFKQAMSELGGDQL